MQEQTKKKKEALYLVEKLIDLAVQDGDRDLAMDMETFIEEIKSGKYDSDEGKLDKLMETTSALIKSYENLLDYKERYKKLTRRVNFNRALLWVVGIVGIAAMAWYVYSFIK